MSASRPLRLLVPVLALVLALVLPACDAVTTLTVTLDVPDGLEPGGVVLEIAEEGEEWPGFTGLATAGEVCDGAATTLTFRASDTGPCHTDLTLSAWFVPGWGCDATLDTYAPERPAEAPWATTTALEGAKCGSNEADVPLELTPPS